VRPTEEQLHAVMLAKAGKAISIEALAGTGKTTTLTLVAKELRGRGQYISFNKAIVNDAKQKFPRAVACNTAHGLAHRSVDQQLTRKLNRAPRITSESLGQWLGAKQLKLGPRGAAELFFDSAGLARLARSTVRSFARSADSALSAAHIPFVPRVSIPAGTRQPLEEAVLPLARRIWADVLSPDGDLPFEHDHYLKIWQLSRPTIAADFILFDEAQDADPVMLDVINHQSCQRIYCGDRFQAIYEWRGAINALMRVSVDETAWLTQSFRFGNAIADVARLYLERLDSPKLIRGNPGLNSTVGPGARASAVLCRTNAGAVLKVIEAQERGRRVAVVGGTAALIDLAQASRKLMAGERTGHSDLASFGSWDQVKLWVESEPDEAGQIATWVRLVDDIGPDALIAALEDCVDESTAELTISTAHRAKGREWKTVYLAGDFQHIDDMDEEELRLSYVAVTRARHHLDDTAWKLIRPKERDAGMRKNVAARSPARKAEPSAHRAAQGRRDSSQAASGVIPSVGSREVPRKSAAASQVRARAGEARSLAEAMASRSSTAARLTRETSIRTVTPSEKVTPPAARGSQTTAGRPKRKWWSILRG
jgi:hypothetical protein